MKTVFIILNYKTYQDTIRLTDDLLRQDLGDRSLLIVDNASPGDSYEVLTRTYKDVPQVEVVSSGVNGGYAKGNNFGLRYARKYNPQYVCIINNDVYFELSLIEKLEKKYVSIREVAFLTPVQHLLNNRPAPFSNLRQIPSFWDDLKMTIGLGGICAKHIYKPDVEGGDLQEVEIVPGAFMFINYSTFERIGFFYEGTFLFCEERFVAKKIRDCGLHSYIWLDEHYVHAHSVTINKEGSKKWQQKLLLNGRVLYAKHHRTYPLLKVEVLKTAYYVFSPLRYLYYTMSRYLSCS